MRTPVSGPPRAEAGHAGFERLLAAAFRRAGWRVRPPRDPRVDLVVEGPRATYVVEVKRTSEGRRDRLIPLLCQAMIQAQSYAREVPVRWIIRKDPEQLLAAVATYAEALPTAARAKGRARGGRIIQAPPRVCMGLYAAADALDLGCVHGVPPHLYLERLDLAVVERLGMSIENHDSRIDAYIRIPAHREAVFRPVVLRGGLPVSGVVQVWLDVSTHPARGHEQAGHLKRRVLGPLFRKG